MKHGALALGLSSVALLGGCRAGQDSSTSAAAVSALEFPVTFSLASNDFPWSRAAAAFASGTGGLELAGETTPARRRPERALRAG
jgi:hypothetical protein